MGFTPQHKQKEYRLDNYRTCKLCGDDVNCGMQGMRAHLDANHSMDEIAKEVSFKWSPDEPQVFHHPRGSVHFVQSYGYDWLETMCGNWFERHKIAPDMDDDEWVALVNYDHVDADDYCGSCESVHRHKYCGTNLPEPLENDD